MEHNHQTINIPLNPIYSANLYPATNNVFGA